MNLVKPPKIIQQLMPRSLVWQFPERTKEIFITFDDGPVPGITPQILEILGQFAAKATFFCVGDNVSNRCMNKYSIRVIQPEITPTIILTGGKQIS